MSAEASLAEADVPSSAAISVCNPVDVSLDTLSTRPIALSAPTLRSLTAAILSSNLIVI